MSNFSKFIFGPGFQNKDYVQMEGHQNTHFLQLKEACIFRLPVLDSLHIKRYKSSIQSLIIMWKWKEKEKGELYF